ncbi:Gfo/Idh/MocA family protein [Paenibacillus spongiae]|uniref:Gfo/Idh/MocA family oxidoreductase n=1 Tax=Paenibacillus spongiae TaxID=2909671 RepID=A0ABY5S196_9BACL|nr:Gfo/Idh/MocA family oxidoreductase [Paenibacillus spongiae]UVI27424.1 Gfo/Idh/MocA family oxidoreductase [Paenibacillus spongiae]
MGFKIGVVGTGFASSFIPLFQAHPLVDEVVLAELIPERLEQTAKKFQIKRTFSSLDELCKSDVDAIALYTNRHLHGPHTLQALRAGKHVYCAVPMASNLEDIQAIMEEVDRSGLIYMTGETSYYYPSTIYCRNRFNNGDFGNIVYGEAAYLHDMSHGFYDAYKHSDGDQWMKAAGLPPMYYPTHSVSMILSVTGAYATQVSCLGYVDKHQDGIFKAGANHWDNPYSNQTALMRTSDGASMRINEFRRVGWTGVGERSVHLSLFGTEGTFEEQANARGWTSLKGDDITDLSALLDCNKVTVGEDYAHLSENLQRDFYSGVSSVHPIHRLPTEFIGLHNGHAGSHQFLVDDFVKAVTEHKLPPNHAWNAARYCVPGLIAHDSCQRNGEMLSIPDFGVPSLTKWCLLEPDKAK